MTVTFSPHSSQGSGPEKPSIRISWLKREAPYDFCDLPRQVHSLLKKGLNDNVRDICTTEQSLTP